MRGRQPVEQEILGLKFTSQPLPFPAAQALLPEVALIVSIAARELGPAFLKGKLKDVDITALLPGLVPVVEHFGQGRLERLAPKLLASTTVVMADLKGDLIRYELLKESDRNAVFEERPDAFLPALFFAGRVTFERFFPASALRTLSERAKGASVQTVSSPST
jgi:hypothetical protein